MRACACTNSSLGCFLCHEASPAPVSDRLWPCSASACRSRSTKSRQEPRSWSGRCRSSGSSGPPGSYGSILVDWTDSPLHLLGYSVPFRGRLPLADLLQHLHTLPEQPSVTPYRTAYYSSA